MRRVRRSTRHWCRGACNSPEVLLLLVGILVGAGVTRSEANPGPSFEIDQIRTTGGDPSLTWRRNQEIDVDSLLAVADVEYARLSSLRADFVQRIDVPLLNRTKEGRGVWSQRGRGHGLPRSVADL